MAKANIKRRKIKGGRRAFLALSADASEHIGEIVDKAVEVARVKLRPSPGIDMIPDTGLLRMSLTSVVKENKKGKKKYAVRMISYGLLVESGNFDKTTFSRRGGQNFLREAFIEVLGSWIEKQPMRWAFKDIK